MFIQDFKKSVQFLDYETDSLKSEVCESWDIKVVIFSIPSHPKVAVQTPLVEDGKCLSREVVFLLNDHLVFSIYTQSLRKHTRSLYGNKHRNATSTMCWSTGNIIPLEKVGFLERFYSPSQVRWCHPAITCALQSLCHPSTVCYVLGFSILILREIIMHSAIDI